LIKAIVRSSWSRALWRALALTPVKYDTKGDLSIRKHRIRTLLTDTESMKSDDITSATFNASPELQFIWQRNLFDRTQIEVSILGKLPPTEQILAITKETLASNLGSHFVELCVEIEKILGE
jgi:hypothetical protein